MPRKDGNKGKVTYVAPDLSYATIKDCAGGRAAYYRGADKIQRLGLHRGEKNLVKFTYKPDAPTEVDRIEKLFENLSSHVRTDDEADFPSHLSPRLILLQQKTTKPPPRKDAEDNWMEGRVTFLQENWDFLVIRACKTGERAYYPDAYDTVRALKLDRPENGTVVFERNPDKPNQALKVDTCRRAR